MVIYTTRTANDELLAVCTSKLPPGKHIAVSGAPALGYLQYILSLDAAWVVNIDEDAFVVNRESLLDLLRFMQQEGYDFCGMPDGGLVSIRYHNPTAMNAYFNIFRVETIKPKLHRFDPSQHNAANSPRATFDFTSRYAYDDFEGYYPLYFWLLKEGFRPLYLLNAMQDSDGITTLLANHKRELMLKHTWYAREWDGQHRTRIQRIIQGLS